MSTAFEKVQTSEAIVEREMALTIGRSVAGHRRPWELRQEVCNLVLTQAMRLPGVKWGDLRFADAKHRNLLFVAWAGPDWPEDSLGRMYSFGRGHVDGVGGLAAYRKRPVLVRDVRGRREYVPIFSEARCCLAVPVMVQGEVAAVVTIDGTEKGGFGREHVDVMRRLAALAAVTLQSVKLAEDAALWEIESHLREERDLHKGLERVVRMSCDLVGGRGCSLFVRNPDSGSLVLEVSTGLAKKRGSRADTWYAEGEGLTGWVAKHGRSLIVPDVNDAAALQKLGEGLEHRSKHSEKRTGADRRQSAQYMAAPIAIDSRILGVIRVSGVQEGAVFSQYDLRLLESVADIIAATMKRRATEERNTKKNKWVRAIADLAQELSSAKTLKEAVKIALDKGLKALGCHSGHLRLWDESAKVLTLVHAKGKYRSVIPETRLLGQGISGAAAERREPIRILDTQSDPRFQELLQANKHGPYAAFLRSIGSGISLPLVAGGWLVGVFNAHWPEPHAFGDIDEAMLSDLSSHLASAINKSLLTEEAQRRAASLKDLVMTTSRILPSAAASDAPVGDFLERAMAIAADAVRSESCHLFLWDEKRGKVVLRAAYGIDKNLVGKAEYSLGEGITGWVAQTGETIRETHGNARKHRAWKGKYDQQILRSLPSRRFKSLLAVPIRTQDGVVGVLAFNNRRETAGVMQAGFGQVDEDAAVVMGWEIGTHLENATYFKNLNHLLGAMRRMLRTADLNETLGQLVDSIGKAIGENRITIHLFNEDRSVLRMAARLPFHVPKCMLKETRITDRTIISHVARTGQVYVAPDVSKSEDYFECYDDTRSEVALPLTLHGQVTGVLSIESTRLHAFGSRTACFLESFASVASLAIERAEIASRMLLEGQTSMLGRLGAMVAHQVKGGLTSVSYGLYQAMQQDLPADAMHWLQQASEQTRTLGEYAYRLSAIAKPATDKRGVNDAGEIVDTVISLFEGLLSRHNIVVRTDFASDLPKILVNRVAVVHALMNVVHNAIDAMPHGGRLTIRTKSSRDRRDVVTSIRDSGCGIRSEHVLHIFEPWFTTKKEGVGTGLGLYVTKQCIEEQGGRIWVERTAPGRGATFAICVPAHRQGVRRILHE